MFFYIYCKFAINAADAIKFEIRKIYRTKQIFLVNHEIVLWNRQNHVL